MVLFLPDIAHVLDLPSVRGLRCSLVVLFGLLLSIRQALTDDHDGVQGGRKQVW